MEYPPTIHIMLFLQILIQNTYFAWECHKLLSSMIICLIIIAALGWKYRINVHRNRHCAWPHVWSNFRLNFRIFWCYFQAFYWMWSIGWAPSLKRPKKNRIILVTKYRLNFVKPCYSQHASVYCLWCRSETFRISSKMKS